MTPYTVVAIEPGFEETLLVKVKSPIEIPDAEKWLPLECDPDSMPAWSLAGAVQAHGTILRQKLSTHPGVAAALQYVLSTPLLTRHPVYFQVQESGAERLRWETLWDDKAQFLALDSRWPIARIADSALSRPSSAPCTFAPPLRVMALLSALGIKAERQWARLYEAVEEARRQGLDIELAAFVGEEGLLEAIEDGIEGGSVSGVRVKALPRYGVQVAAAVETFKPHLLHFFCHGSAAFGAAQLEMATVTDWDLGTSSVRLGVNDLLPALRDVWLVTLNCCEGGKSVGDVHSLAHTLVAGGVPAAVGMLEPIDAGDAHEFCGAFYAALFRSLQRLQDLAAGEELEIEWVDALFPPRAILSQAHPLPVDRPEWTLPVLYVRPGEFRVSRDGGARLDDDQVSADRGQEDRPPPAGALEVLRQKAEVAAAILRTLPPETPEEVRQQILDTTLRGLPPSMRPDRNGNFPAVARELAGQI